MGRRPRVFVPGYPHHVVQRGHNRNATFFEPADFRYYLDNLQEWKVHYDVDVCAYCLMTNHVHLLLVPNGDGPAISGLMRRLSARQGRYVNRLENRVGSLWAGRFKSSVVDTDAYFLACVRYIELNPVRAGMVSHPEDYPWSSYAGRIAADAQEWLSNETVSRIFSKSDGDWRSAYRSFIAAGVPENEYTFIRDALCRNQLTGGQTFVDQIEQRTGVRVEARGRGRPRKKVPE